MNTNFKTINKTEIDDFISTCNKYKASPDEFQLDEKVNNVETGDGTYIKSGIVTISRNGKNKEYKTGHGTSWLPDFDNDLSAGYFNKSEQQ